MSEFEIIARLGIALALGLLIGTERGWAERGLEDGKRIAGIRSFGLIGLLGALWALLSRDTSVVIVVLAFVAFGGLLIVAYWLKAQASQDIGITTEIAASIAFVLGAAAMQGHLSVTAAAAVVTTVLLGLKPKLHGWLERLQAEELNAALKLLLISVVVLPVLPDRGFGLWHALNPYEIWWMVVLVAAISFLGYCAIKIAGTGRGIMLTAFAGGLASSTAVTLNLSRLARREPAMQRVLAAGVLAASSTMFLRMLVIANLIEPKLWNTLAWPLLLMTASGYGIAYRQCRAAGAERELDHLPLQNPFDMKTALQFGALLAVVTLLVAAFREWFGTVGIYLVAALSGVSGVDAITLSLARLVSEEIPGTVVAEALVLAATVNTISKTVLAAAIARGTMATRLAEGCVLIAIAGFVGLMAPSWIRLI